MSARYHESIIRRVPLFASLPAHLFDLLAPAFEQRRYSAGDMILVQGTIPTGLYILLQGQAIWIQTALNGTVNQLGMMQVGQHIHNEALFRDNIVDTASLQAISTTTMLILNRKTLNSLLTKRPELQMAFGIRVALPKSAPKPAAMKKAVRTEAETIQVGSVSPFLGSFETASGATVYRKHWILWLAQVSFPVLLCLIGLGAMLSLLIANSSPEFASSAWAMSGLVLFFGLSWFFAADWLWRNDFFLLSDSHISMVKRPALFQKRQIEAIALQSVKEVMMLPPNLGQRIMAHGDLHIVLMDGDEDIYLENIARPMLMQREIIRRQQAFIRRGAQDNDRREREVLSKFKNAYEETKPMPSLPYDYPEAAPRPSPFGQPRPKTGEIQPEQNLPPNPLMPQKGSIRPPKFPRKLEP
jgi:CRP-like cAMP-binding protein